VRRQGRPTQIILPRRFSSVSAEGVRLRGTVQEHPRAGRHQRATRQGLVHLWEGGVRPGPVFMAFGGPQSHHERLSSGCQTARPQRAPGQTAVRARCRPVADCQTARPQRAPSKRRSGRVAGRLPTVKLRGPRGCPGKRRSGRGLPTAAEAASRLPAPCGRGHVHTVRLGSVTTRGRSMAPVDSRLPASPTLKFRNTAKLGQGPRRRRGARESRSRSARPPSVWRPPRGRSAGRWPSRRTAGWPADAS